jgi:hypothetical protein
LSAAPRQRLALFGPQALWKRIGRAQRPAKYANDVAGSCEFEPKICFNWSSETFAWELRS